MNVSYSLPLSPSQFLMCGLIVFVLIVGCESKEDLSTNTSSQTFASIEDKIQFLEKYVNFRRNYHDLAYNIVYQDNEIGWLPGPSDWSISIIAQVPKEELGEWINNLTPTYEPAIQLLEQFPEITFPTDQIDEWYTGTLNLVGIDHQNSVVFYQSSTMGY